MIHQGDVAKDKPCDNFSLKILMRKKMIDFSFGVILS